MSKKLAVVIGNHSLGQDSFNGQTVKTRDYYHYLAKRYGEDKVSRVDTFNWKKRPVRTFFKLFFSCAKHKNVVLLLGINGARVITPFVVFLKKIFRFKILFPVVGGGIMYDYENHKKLNNSFNSIDAIYFETKMMMNCFKEKGFDNIYYAPVFSRRVLNAEPNTDNIAEPFKFCTYARVCKEKGISIAIDAVTRINERFGKTVCTLDIFGDPYDEYKEEFYEKLAKSNGAAQSKPYLSGDGVIDTLSQYALMLFPTYYDGEGFPIAIVECMLGGVPVIASDWHFNSEIVINEKTGYIFSLDKLDDFEEILADLISNPAKISEMKLNCLEYAKNFAPESVLKDIFDRIDN